VDTKTVDLRTLIGSGDRIALFTLPFAAVGLIANVAVPTLFDVGGPATALAAISVAALVAGVAIWLWSVVLILTEVPRGELITTGPFAWMKHPIYTSVALLVIPAIGLLLNTWVGVPIGIAMYVGSRMYAPAEEATLAATFGERWDAYRASVRIPWL
jgi:protein-S-isoprenylcysteine O-methyltransferase Ste14